MRNSERPLYEEQIFQTIKLTKEQKRAVCEITMSLDFLQLKTRKRIVKDVIKSLQNGHPLNRLMIDDQGEVVGYLACEDLFQPDEVYVKFFGTNGNSGRELLREIPLFFQAAEKLGYNGVSFLGCNERLNGVMKRYGFRELFKEKVDGRQIPFYVKKLK